MNEQDIPIDINTTKLLDWLISRRHCSKEWQKNILNIREKINNAIQDMPVHEGIVKLLSGTYINYFHCLKIVEILKETEADSKNIFGRYGSQRMKDWQEIIRLYERDHIYLAEAAQMLMRNVNYEIPSLKKQIAKLEQMQAECEKKEKDYAKSERVVRGEFNSLCKQLGILGNNIKRELIDMLAELPSIYEETAKNIKNIAPAIELYEDLLEFTLGKQHVENFLPSVKYVIAHGNTTTYEWTYGEPPIRIEEPTVHVSLEENPNKNETDGIDFGDTNDCIDFGDLSIDGNQIDFGDITSNQEDIDWGAIETSSPDVQEIDFNISLEESGIVVEDAGNEGGIARNAEALTVLDNPSTRGKIIDEIMELESFLKMRLYELSSTNMNHNLSQLYTEGSAVLQLQTQESVTELLNLVQGALAIINDKRNLHLYNIKHSPRYVDYLTDSLQQKIGIAEKMQSSQKVMKLKREELIQQQINLQPVINVIVEKTKLLQEQIEEDISKKYKNRPVNLLGGVNSL